MTDRPEVITFHGCAIPDCEQFPVTVLFDPEGPVRGFCVDHGQEDLERYLIPEGDK